MISVKRILLSAVFFCGIILITGLAVKANATPITFTHQGTGSGTLGGTSFSNAAFTITDVGDTGNRVSTVPGYSINDTSASRSVLPNARLMQAAMNTSGWFDFNQAVW